MADLSDGFAESEVRGLGPFDPGGFNIFTSPRGRLRAFFGVIDICGGMVVDRFLFNVGQPQRGPSMYPNHVDIPNCGSVRRIRCRDLRTRFSDLTLELAGHQYILRSYPLDGLFIIDITLPANSDSSLVPALFFGGGPEDGVLLTASSAGGLIEMRGKGSVIVTGISENHHEMCRTIGLPDLGPSLAKLPAGLQTGLHQGGAKASRSPFQGSENRGGCILMQGRGRLVFALGTSIPSTLASGGNPCSSNLSDPVFSMLDCRLQELRQSFDTGPLMDSSDFGDLVEAIRNLVSWNTLYNRDEIPDQFSGLDNASPARDEFPDTGRENLYVTVNRSWVEMIGKVFDIEEGLGQGPLIFNWDTSLSALLASLFDPALARRCVYSVLQTQRPDGMIPQLRINGMVNQRSNPPVLPLCVWKIYLRHGGLDFLGQVYEPLCRWMEWFEENRKNRYGLYAWGARPGTVEERAFMPSSGKISAAYESGLDDSPMWEELEWDDENSCLAASCVDLSSLMAISYSVLGLMAGELGDRQTSEIFAKKSEEISSRMDELLYDSRSCVYKNRKHDGGLARFITPASFYPLILGLADSRTTGAVINYGLLNRDLCWGDFPLSSIAKNYWGYNPDGDYWRGRIWPPLNYLVYQGLRTHSHSAAHRLARVSARLFAREFWAENHVHENYSALTGWGEPEEGTYARSCPFYTWGGLMALMYVEELLDFDLDGTMRIGSPFFMGQSTVTSIPVKGRGWSVSASEDSLTVLVDNNIFIQARPVIGIRGFSVEDGRMVFTLYGRGETEVYLRPSALLNGPTIARLYDSDLFLGKFDLAESPVIRMILTLEPNVPKAIKIKLLG